MLERGLDRLLEANTDKGIVFGDYGAFNAGARTDVSLGNVCMDMLLVCNQIPIGAYVMERNAVTHKFDTRLRSHEDWDFLLSNAAAGMLHVPGSVVMIDKTENQSTSTEGRRRRLFWLDFLSIYARFPASHLSATRISMLHSLGISLPESMLQFDDLI